MLLLLHCIDYFTAFVGFTSVPIWRALWSCHASNTSMKLNLDLFMYLHTHAHQQCSLASCATLKQCLRLDAHVWRRNGASMPLPPTTHTNQLDHQHCG